MSLRAAAMTLLGYGFLGLQACAKEVSAIFRRTLQVCMMSRSIPREVSEHSGIFCLLQVGESGPEQR